MSPILVKQLGLKVHLIPKIAGHYLNRMIITIYRIVSVCLDIINSKKVTRTDYYQLVVIDTTSPPVVLGMP